MANLFAWVNETGRHGVISGEGVPEGIAYPQSESLSPFAPEWEVWKAEALAAGRASWRAIGDRRAFLVARGGGVTHALRNEPRGYGRRRREWARTTECGQMFSLSMPREPEYTIPLRLTTCLACRKIVRERFENDLRYDRGFSDLGMDAYDAQHADDWWKIQAEWHKPDPIVLWNIPADLGYSLAGG